jgi:hypothetical protein
MGQSNAHAADKGYRKCTCTVSNEFVCDKKKLRAVSCMHRLQAFHISFDLISTKEWRRLCSTL